MSHISRHICFYRPFGFKKNNFMLFYTQNPSMYVKQINKQFQSLENNGFFDIAQHMNVMMYKPIFKCTKESFENYKNIYGNISKKFTPIEDFDYTKKVNYWPYVQLSDEELIKIEKFDEYIKELLSK